MSMTEGAKNLELSNKLTEMIIDELDKSNVKEENKCVVLELIIKRLKIKILDKQTVII